MVVHARGENHVLDFFVAAPGLGLDGARARGARADRRPLLRGRDPALQRRAGLVRRLRHHARPGGDAGALRQRAPRRPHRRAGPRGARRRRGRADAGVPVRGPAADPHLHAGVRRDLRAGGPAARGGRHDPAARARRPARPARRGGPGLPLRRRRGRSGERLGARARRHAEPRGPQLVRGDRARARARDLPGARGDHEPAAVLRRDPDRGRARDPRAPRPARTTRTCSPR